MTAAPTIPLTIRVTNIYPELGREFTHVLDVSIARPSPATLADDDLLYDFLLDQLFEHTGEGPEYADAMAGYFVTVLASPDLPELVGYEVTAGV